MLRSSLLIVAALLFWGCQKDESKAEPPAKEPPAAEAPAEPEVPDDVTWAEVQKQFQALEKERESVMELVKQKADLQAAGQTQKTPAPVTR